MEFLITGGAGFIGSHLADALLDRGHSVVLLDDFSTGRSENISHIVDRVTVVHGSVLDPLIVDELVSRCDAVVHLAAAVGVRLIVDQPLRSLITNIRGSETILEAAHRYRRQVMLASTSEIYGKNQASPFSEDDDQVLGSPRVARWAYATSKTVDEILAFAYHRERGLPTIVVRLFNTTGPRQTGAYGMVLPRFVSQALRGEPLTVHGDGQQTRCLCHVQDSVDAMLALLQDPRAQGDVFNVGSTEEITILELAERVIQQTGSSSQITMVPYEEAYESGFEDMRRRVPDISKIKALTGWEPTRRLNTIISELADHVRSSEHLPAGK